MYFHGLEGIAHPVSRVTLSENGVDFVARPEVIGLSCVSVIVSPSLASLPPQHGQAVGAGTTTRSRGR